MLTTILSEKISISIKSTLQTVKFPSHLGCLLLTASTLSSINVSGAQFTYMETNASGDELEVFDTLSDLQNGTRSSNTSVSWNQTGIRGVGFNGTEYMTMFDSLPIEYNSFAALATNDTGNRTVGTAISGGSTSVFGIASDSVGNIYVIWDDNTTEAIFTYTRADFMSNTHGNRSTQLVSWDPSTADIAGFGTDNGSNFYVAVNSGGNDVVASYSSLASLGADTDIATTTGGGTISPLGTGGGQIPDFGAGVGFAVTPVPEPATYGLISGFLLLATAHIRRRNRK